MKHKSLILLAIAGFIILSLVGLLIGFSMKSNPWNAKCIGDIPCPIGYTRLATDDTYAEFLRDLPLKKRGTPVRLYNGGIAHYQFLSAGVIDWPVLSNAEQCADVTMRIRAEYLWQNGQYNKIRFKSVGGKNQNYYGGSTRSKFESYLKDVYEHSNTASVYNETQVRDLSDVRPGDVLVYPSRQRGRYGHAILVADVAKSHSGKTAILCIEGNTPAREAHVVRNMNPFHLAWFILDGDEALITVNVFRFKKEELRHY